MNFTASKINSTGDYVLKVDGCEFGRLSNCEIAHVFTSSDSMLNDYIHLEADMSIPEMLAAVKVGYLNYISNMEAEHAAEAASERAYYNYIENDVESYDEMVREDMEGFS